MKYLINTYIIDFRHHFVKAYINQVLHFNTIITSRDEGGHAVLKRQLGSFIEDLKTMIDDIDLLLINELHNHLIALDETKVRYPLNLRKSIYQQIASYTTFFVIRRIHAQFELLTEQITYILACIEFLTTTMSLFCSHRIQKMLFEEDALQLKDIHSH
jgi:hypothetical protein